jgi:hypothetical protein
MFFRRTLLFNELSVFLKSNRLRHKKINHIHKLVGLIITNLSLSIVGPIFDHQNEMIQIFNTQPWLSKVCDDTNNIKDILDISICDLTIPNTWHAKKIALHVVPTKLLCSIDCINNYWNHSKSFFKVEMTTSLVNPTCPKKRSSFLVTLLV